MLRGIAIALVVAAWVVSVGARRAEPVPDSQVWDSGNDFLYMCHDLGKPADELSSLQMFHGNICMAYLNGLSDGLNLEITLSNQSGTPLLLPYCVPQDVKKIQIYLVTVKYVQDNPAQAHLPTATLFGRAMKAAFPCPSH